MEYKTRAYGKVNIGLKVGEKRADGYHNIDSYFLLIPFFDELEFSLAEGPYSVAIEGNEKYLASGKMDIMEKAAFLYHERSGVDFSLRIKVSKHIPQEAGLGGGSTDASAVLSFLNSCFHAFSSSDLLYLSKEVGADVPFFLSGEKCAKVGGIGEKITPMEWTLPYKYISLFRALNSGVSTKEAYEELDKRKTEHYSLPPLTFPLTREVFPNDFEILEGKEMLKTISPFLSPSDYASLSGSGSVWFLLSKERKNPGVKEFLGCREIL